jgi:hypothetical protein
MNFGEKVNDLHKKIEEIMPLLSAFDKKNIELFNKVMSIDFEQLEKIVKASVKIKKSQKDILLVENGIHDIRRVVEMQNQVANVSNTRDSIGLVAGNIERIGLVAGNIDAIENIVNMNDKMDHVLKMNAKINKIIDEEDKLDYLIRTTDRLEAKLDLMQDMQIRTQKSAILATNIINKINIKEKTISEKYNEIKNIRDDIRDISVVVKFVDSDSNASSNYSRSSNRLTLNIPSGKKGDTGERGERGFQGVPGIPGSATREGKQGVPGKDGNNFKIDIMGNKRELTRYGNRPVGTSFLAVDENPAMIYFRKSNALDDWTDGQPFGISNGGLTIQDIADAVIDKLSKRSSV